MKLLFERRASTVLYNVLKSRRDTRPILIPANVCACIPLVLLKAGQAFEVIDISEADLCIAREQVHSRIRSVSKPAGGVLFVHTYGASAVISDFYQEIKQAAPTALIIDDRCLAPPILPTTMNGADVVLYSTGSRKYVDFGEGGFGYACDALNYNRHCNAFKMTCGAEMVERLATAAIVDQQVFDYVDCDWLSGSAPITPWGDFLARIQDAIRLIDSHKSKLNTIYQAIIPPDAQFPSPFNVWRFQVRVRQPMLLVERLCASSLFASRHYPSVAKAFGGESTPVADTLADEVVNLFNDHYFSEEQALRAADIVANHVHTCGVPSRSQRGVL